MRKPYSTSLWALAFVLVGSGKLLADPFINSLQIGPQAPDPVDRGSSATYSITITKTNSGGMDIYMTAPDLPPEATVSFSPNPIVFKSGSTSGTVTMLISTTGAILPGPHPFSVKATDGGSQNTMTIATSFDVTLSSPGVVPLANGGWCFAFAAQPGQSYQIQANTNFSSPFWTTLCTTNSGTNSLLVFIDRDVTHYQCRFYRSVAQ
jgi:hypothetical protein